MTTGQSIRYRNLLPGGHRCASPTGAAASGGNSHFRCDDVSTLRSFNFSCRYPKSNTQKRTLLLVLMSTFVWAATSAYSQQPAAEPDPGSKKLSLPERQAIIRDRVARLEDRMFQLSQAIRKAEPEKAEQLLESLGAARGMMVRQKMEEIVRKLDQSQYADATDTQKEVAADLQALLRMLLEGPEKLEDRKKEIERLEALKQQLDGVIREQREARQNAQAAAGKTDEKLDAAINKLEKLFEQQNALSSKTARPGAEMQKTADEQEQLRTETESLADDLRAAQSEQSGSPTADGTMSEAAEKLEEAAGKMEDAEQQMRQGNPDLAKPPQEEAQQDLKEALELLKEKAKRDTETRKAQAPLDKQAEKQKEITEKTKQLGQKMDPSPGGSPSESGRQGEQKSGEQQGEEGQQGGQSKPKSDEEHSEDEHESPTPGARDVQEAVPFQEEAEQNLDQQDPNKAEQAQGKALEKLEQARKELEETLEQLRKEQQEELLAALEGRFKAMLARQLEVNKSTERLEDLGVENWRRADQLELADLSQKQSWVGEEADRALYILKEEGTTVVFPQVVEHLRDDAAEAARLLAAATTGTATQSIQASIVNTLRELIEAIEKKQAESEGGGGEGGGGGDNQNQPLLPASAELKLLRSCQVRVNDATIQFEVELSAADRESDVLRDRREKLARRQEQVHEMARSMHEALRRAQ